MTQEHKEIDNAIFSELLKHPTKLIEEFESALEIISTTKDLNELNVWATNPFFYVNCLKNQKRFT